MPRIEVDIPDWARERDIYVFAGVEVLAVKPFNRDILHVKTARCNLCGECCSMLRPPHPPPIYSDENGRCVYLNQAGREFECAFGAYRPWRCCVAEPILGKREGAKQYCSIRYREVPVR